MKKANLNMSINTIVVLILAMTLLGFGLMFVKGTFTKATSQFDQVGGQVEKQLKDTLTEGSERLVLQSESFEIKRGQSKTTYFAIRNDLGSDEKFMFYDNTGDITTDGTSNGNSIVMCYTDDSGGEATDVKNKISFNLLHSFTLKSGDVKVFPLKITVKSTATAGTTYYCAFYIQNPTNSSKQYARSDFTITVKS